LATKAIETASSCSWSSTEEKQQKQLELVEIDRYGLVGSGMGAG
jgi:hypothetical protein